jgi:hypothetical protein
MHGGLSRIFALVTLAGLGWSPAGWGSDCPVPNTPSQVAERLVDARSALSKMDFDQFSFSMEEVELMVPCLGALPSRAAAADLHRMLGVYMYTAGKSQAANDTLRAAKVLVPAYRFPDDLFPEGYALIDVWSGVETDDPKHVRAPVPKKSDVAFDGVVTRDRPADRATLFQHISTDGAVLQTIVIQPDQALPAYESVPRQRNRIIGATVAAGVAAGISYGLAWHERRSFDKEDGSRSRADLKQMRQRVNTAFTLSGAFSTVTVSGVVAAIVIGPR